MTKYILIRHRTLVSVSNFENNPKHYPAYNIAWMSVPWFLFDWFHELLKVLILTINKDTISLTGSAIVIILMTGLLEKFLKFQIRKFLVKTWDYANAYKIHHLDKILNTHQSTISSLHGLRSAATPLRLIYAQVSVFQLPTGLWNSINEIWSVTIIISLLYISNNLRRNYKRW